MMLQSWDREIESRKSALSDAKKAFDATFAEMRGVIEEHRTGQGRLEFPGDEEKKDGGEKAA